MKKFSVKYVSSSNCYVSLPRSFSSLINQNYSETSICKPIKLANSAGKSFYMGFNGLMSSNEQEIEISDVFCKLNDIKEGELLELKLESQINSSKKLVFFCQNDDDYEIVSRKREKIELSLLNGISIVFPGVKIPIYYNNTNYVVLEYVEETENKLDFCSINTEAEIIIQTKEASQKAQTKNETLDYKFICKVCKLNEPFEKDASLFSPYIYLNEELFKKYNLNEVTPYYLNHKLIKNRNSLTNIEKYIKKLEHFNKDKKKNGKQIYCYIKPFKCDENFIFMNGTMMKTFNLKNKTIISMKFNSKLTDFSKHKMINIFNLINDSRFHIYFFPISTDKNYDALIIKSIFIDKLILAAKQKKIIVIYRDNLININGNTFAAKVLENSQDHKSVIEFFCFTNHLLESKDLESKNIEILHNFLDKRISILKQHDFNLNFPERIKHSYEKFIKTTGVSKSTAGINYSTLLFSKEIDEITKILISYFEKNEKSLDENSLLITGNSGVGKTKLIKHIKKNLDKYNFNYINFNDITNIRRNQVPSFKIVKEFLEENVQFTEMQGSGVVILDNCQSLLKNVERIDFQQVQEILMAEVFSKMTKDLVKTYSRNFFIFITQSKDYINKQLYGLIGKEIQLKLPNFSERKKIIETIFRKKEILNNNEIDEISTISDNFTISNFALFHSRIKILENPKSEQIFEILNSITNKTFKQTKKYPKFNDVGGLDSVKQLIRDTFETPQKYSFIYKNIPIKMANGVLLYGPSGCGKTFMASATANELGMNFLSVKGPELLNKYIGASEQAVRDIFEKALNVKPCIVFFDEFDAIVPKRNSGSTNVTDRVVNQFLCYLDGVSSLNGVYILAATSRPDLIDPALIRPGRIDKHIYLGFPTEEDREKILEIYFKNFKFCDLTQKQIAERTQGFTPSDLVALLREMQINVAHSFMENAEENKEMSNADIIFYEKDFEETMKNFKRALSEKEMKKIEKIYLEFTAGKSEINVEKQKTRQY